MKNKASDIALIFNYFHDGTIKSIKLEDKTLSFEIYIPYIADIYKTNNTTFYLSLFNVSDAYLVPWGKNENKIYDFSDFNQLGLEILSADLNIFDYIEIQTEAQTPSKFVPEGGMIFVKTNHCQVYDEELERIEASHLADINKKYWEEAKRH